MNIAEEYFLTGKCEVTPVKITDPLHRVSLDGETIDVIDCADEVSVKTLNITIKINFVFLIFSFFLLINVDKNS
jgi:hypothetical protein